jgi:hypothetical protein
MMIKDHPLNIDLIHHIENIAFVGVPGYAGGAVTSC